MDFNPHSLHMILSRIRQQMRCPQCGTIVSVDWPSVKVAADDFMILELKCGSCMAYIVLHVNLRTGDLQNLDAAPTGLNASSTLVLSEDEMKTLRGALDAYDGSFEKLFQKQNQQL